LRSGSSIKEVAETSPGTFIKYHRGIREWKRVCKPQTPRDFKTLVWVFVGKTGVGKTRLAKSLASETETKTFYFKPRGDWWDGYEQQESVIIDDFYGWVKFDELLRVCDRYPMLVPVKGGFEVFNSKWIYITSNIPVSKWYRFRDYDPAPLYRRIDCYKEIQEGGIVVDHEESLNFNHMNVLKEITIDEIE